MVSADSRFALLRTAALQGSWKTSKCNTPSSSQPVVSPGSATAPDVGMKTTDNALGIHLGMPAYTSSFRGDTTGPLERDSVSSAASSDSGDDQRPMPRRGSNASSTSSSSAILPGSFYDIPLSPPAFVRKRTVARRLRVMHLECGRFTVKFCKGDSTGDNQRGSCFEGLVEEVRFYESQPDNGGKHMYLKQHRVRPLCIFCLEEVAKEPHGHRRGSECGRCHGRR